MSAVGAVLGLLLGAALAYGTQVRLEAKRRAVSERRLAYALLVQVCESVGRTQATLRRLPELAKPLDSIGIPQSAEGYDAPDFWCALITELLANNPDFEQVVEQVKPWLDGVVQYNEVALSGLLMKGGDVANLPTDVLPSFHRAAMSQHAVKSGMAAIVETIRTDRSKLRPDLTRGLWRETLKLTKRMVELQLVLAKAAGTRASDVDRLTQEFELDARRDIAATASNSQSMVAAIDAAKGYLASLSRAKKS